MSLMCTFVYTLIVHYAGARRQSVRAIRRRNALSHRKKRTVPLDCSSMVVRYTMHTEIMQLAVAPLAKIRTDLAKIEFPICRAGRLYASLTEDKRAPGALA